MAKFPEAEARMFKNRFVCRRCKTVQQVSPRKIAENMVTCRKCKYKKFKPKRKR